MVWKDRAKFDEAVREHKFLNMYSWSTKQKKVDLEQHYVVPWQMILDDIKRPKR